MTAPEPLEATADNHLPRTDPRWGWEFVIENFVLARLTEDADAANALTDPDARAVELHRIQMLRTLTAAHSIYINQSSGHNWARCYTCAPGHGTPCMTIRLLARLWPEHPDQPCTEEDEQFLQDQVAAGTFRLSYEQHQN